MDSLVVQVVVLLVVLLPLPTIQLEELHYSVKEMRVAKVGHILKL